MTANNIRRRSPQLPSFTSSVGLPPALPRTRKPARRQSREMRRLTALTYCYLCSAVILALSVGIGIGAVTRLPVPASVVEAK
jgi:hypothetical protein